MRGILWSLTLVMLAAGCGDTSTTANQDVKGGSQNAADDDVPAATVFDPMVSTMDRAAAVEGISMSRKQEMDNAIDGSE